MNKISLQMYTMREHTKTMADLRETLFKLKDIGFTRVQYSIPKHYNSEEVKKIFDEAKMGNDSVFCSWQDLEERRGEIIKQCEMFDANLIRIDSIPQNLSVTASGYKMFAHYLNEVGEAYKKEGKKLLYHFHAFEFIRFGNDSGIDIILNETDPETLEIIPDTHWLQTGGKNPVEFLRQHKDRYTYMHAKDYAVGPRGEMLEAHSARYAAVGEGTLDWDGIISVCKENNVKSYGIEQDDCYGRSPFDCVKSSFDFLMKMGVND